MPSEVALKAALSLWIKAMENNQCPKCRAELGEKQECTSCGFNLAGPAGIAPAPGGEVPDATRNVRPPSPPGPPPEATQKGDGGDNLQPNAPQAITPKTPRAAAQNDPGRPFLAREMRNLKPIAERYIKQKGSKKGGRNIVAGGDYSETHRTQIDQLNAIFTESRERRSVITTVSLMDVTSKLPDREPQIPDKASYNLDPHLGRLKEQHVLFLSCVDEGVAFGAAYALLDELNIAGEQRLFLNFSRNTEKSNAVIQLFTQSASEERHELTAIVIDGFNVEARTFLDWLRTGTLGHALDVRSHLHSRGFFLLCPVEPEYLQKTPGTRTFSTWSVPFLLPLLTKHFPAEATSLEKEILAQQKLGKWKQSDTELCGEIRGLLEDDLPNVVAQRRSAPVTQPATVPAIAPESLFKGGHSIEDTLLYAATYFSDLPPSEFDQLVNWLLADRTTTVSVKTQHRNADGTIQIIETETQKPLREFWDDDPDSYLATCELEAVTGSNLPTSIRFANEANREKLKAHLEKQYSLYLVRQFRILESNNFLTSAPHISDRAMSLSIDMALAYPGSFGKEWLLKIIVNAHNDSKSSPHTDKTTITIGKNKTLERITLFVRLMLEKPQLEEVVNGLLKDLMSLGNHEIVLFLVRGLQFAPEFDEFYWMKRLLDEGDKDIKDSTYYHLYSYIQKIGVHSLLSKLEAWIPTDDRPLNYSPACIFSLRLLVEYCSEVTETFERDQALRHPLFTFSDDKVAQENYRRLIRWFFHPGMTAVFADLDSVFEDDRPDTRVLPFICELLLEWMVVLREQEASSTSSTNSEQFLNVERIRDSLIESLAEVTAPNQRSQMLVHWERLRDFLGLIVDLSDASDWFGVLNSEEKKAILTTRRVVKDLIKRFRTAIRAAKLRNQHVVTV